MLYEQYYPFKIIPLEYEYYGLEPEIGEYTVFFHYNEHYLPTLEKLNKLVGGSPVLQNCSLEELTKNADKDIARAAGSVFGHELYFSSLSGNRNEPSDNMKRRIKSDFGSMEGFIQAMEKAAEQVYGSGYLWLAEDSIGRLVPIVTKDHDTPDLNRLKPVYATDLWEHSYYLDRQNDRSVYVSAALDRINWDEIEHNLRTV